ncbi:MAG: 4Fe-4S binding protein [Candidatus Anammoximicrobium sp.]|nr:4Fe-4S binding protein [Candidatus Anammoximicrobium sp.]
MGYWSKLSRTQYAWLAGTAVAMCAVVAIGWALQPRSKEAIPEGITTAMSLREIAPRLKTTGKALARELELPLSTSMRTPVSELGISEQTLNETVVHLASHHGTGLKYFVFAALVLGGLVFLTQLGRPADSPSSERRRWYPRTPYILALLVAAGVCGFALGKSPNPMEGAVKLFKAMVGLQPSVPAVVLAFMFFAALAVVGNKLVCGWACPFGALQELVYSLPLLRSLKRRKVPFVLSNSIRAGLFVLMLLLLFGVVGGRRGFVLYHGINPFNLFNLEFESLSMLLTVVAALVLSLGVYRPFCQFICPFGLISWVLERVSLNRIKVDHSRCNQCGSCIRACPLEAAKHLVAGKLLAADCYSCARCLTVCPSDAISYGSVFSSRPPSLTQPPREGVPET